MNISVSLSKYGCNIQATGWMQSKGTSFQNIELQSAEDARILMNELEKALFEYELALIAEAEKCGN